MLRARVRHASDRLVAAVSFRAHGPWGVDETTALRAAAIALAAEVARGLNDCLQVGVLDGYVALNANRLSELVVGMAGKPTIPEPDEIAEDPGIEAWLGEVNRHVGVLRHPDTSELKITREAFATIGAAVGMAAYLAGRIDELSPST